VLDDPVCLIDDARSVAPVPSVPERDSGVRVAQHYLIGNVLVGAPYMSRAEGTFGVPLPLAQFIAARRTK